MPPPKSASPLRLCLAAAIFFCAWEGRAETAHLIPGYCCKSWQVDDGLPNNSVASLVQTSDGMLWLGTYDGFVAFDGLRFSMAAMEAGKALVTEGILQLKRGDEGAIWGFSDRGRVFELCGGKPRRVLEDRRLAGRLESVQAAPPAAKNGACRFWILRPEGDVLEFVGERLIPHGTDGKAIAVDAEGECWMLSKEGQIQFPAGAARPFPASFVNKECGAIAADAARNIYIARTGELWRWNGGALQRLGAGEDLEGITALYPAGDGSVWIRQGEQFRLRLGDRWAGPAALTGIAWVQTSVIDHSGALWIGEMGKGITVVRPDGGMTKLRSPTELVSDRVAALECDREGAVWAAFYDGGLQQLIPRDFETIGRNEGLPEMAPTSIAEDAVGVIWVAGHGAPLSRVMDGKFTPVPYSSGATLPARVVFCDREGAVWAGAFDHGLWKYSGSVMTPVHADAAGLKNTRALFEDRSGALWIGTDGGAFRLRGDDLSRAGAVPEARICGFAQSRDGAIWVATDGAGVFRIGEGDRDLGALTVREGLPANAISMVYADSDGAAWIGANGCGLCRWKEGRIALIGEEQGLSDETPLAMWEDGAGAFWLTSVHGIMRVNAEELRECADGGAKRAGFVLFGKEDGMTTAECMGRLQPTLCHARDGTTWLPTSRDIVRFQPAAVRINRAAPIPVVESFLVNDTLTPVSGAVARIKPGVERIEISFRGISLAAPGKVRYRRKLEGLETEWVEAGLESHVSYGHLRPGR